MEGDQAASRRRVRRFGDLESMSRTVAEMISHDAQVAVAERGMFSLVLSGGSTPRRLFELLGAEWMDRIPWSRTHLFWSDERFVAADHPESNFGGARELFLDSVPIPASNVHPIPTGVPSSLAGAAAYESMLRDLFPEKDSPDFDVALLGMGEDGHTASLFPAGPLESRRWVEAVRGPDDRPPVERITLTAHALSGCRRVAFLIVGAEKSRVFDQIFRGEAPDLPAARIMSRGEVVWFVARAGG